MDQHNYIYSFEDLSHRPPSLVHIESPSKEHSTARVWIDDAALLFARQHHLPAHLADVLDLAMAVAVADRLSVRRADYTRHLSIRLPLRHPELFQQSPIRQQLERLLYWYTLDHWCFEFCSRSRPGRLAEAPLSLVYPSTPDAPVEVALWSGGLDSLAGLYHRLSETASTTYTLCGTGMNGLLISKQRACASEIAKQFPKRTKLIQIPFGLDETRDLPKNTLQRSRGFVFLLIGAVCALLENQQQLSIYENGIGAINLPYSDAEVGLDHSRAVHPLSLFLMGKFISSVIGTPFTFRNPFLFATKAQLCESLAFSPRGRDLVAVSFTCDGPHREVPLQCGYCSSCLLRRQALAVLGVDDPTAYISTLPQRAILPSYRDYLRAMHLQVASLRECLVTADPWTSLSQQHSFLYLPLRKIVDEMGGEKKSIMQEDLLRLYMRYSDEWEQVHPLVGQELLEEQRPTPLARK